LPENMRSDLRLGELFPEPAKRLLLERQRENPSHWKVIASVAEKLQITHRTTNPWPEHVTIGAHTQRLRLQKAVG
jgi:hypothetical protein